MKPHLYRLHGQWWVAREGRHRSHLYSAPRPSFPEACYLAMLVAIHSGVWRA